MLVTLPCGIEKDGTIYDHVIVKELTGKQQNYLVDMELVSNNMGHVPKLLEDLTENFQTKEGMPLGISSKDAVWMLTSEDVEHILIKIRENTYGPVLGLPVACLHCSKQQVKKIDLDKLEVSALADKAVRTKEVELIKSHKKVTVKLLYLKDLFKLYESLRKNPETLYTSSLYLSVQAIDEKTVLKPSDLDDLPITDLQQIEQAFSDLRASVDTTIINECDECGKEFNTALPVMDPTFFVPPQTPKT